MDFFLTYPWVFILIVWAGVLWSVRCILFHVQEFRTPSRAAVFSLLICTLAVVLQCYCTALTASELNITDSVEYAIAGERLYSLGTYNINIEGVSYAPRYPPFFSMLFVVPAQALFHAGLGSSIYLVFALGLIGFIAAWIMAYSSAGIVAANLITALILIIPDFRLPLRAVLTDGPLIAVALLLLLSYSRFTAKMSARQFIPAGVLLGFIVLLRITNVIVALPFILLALRSRMRGTALLGLCVPIFVALGAHFSYNASVFGAPLRTGYNYWTSVPTDFPALLYSFQYVPRNLQLLLSKGSVAALLTVVLGISILAGRFSMKAPVPVAIPDSVSSASKFSLLIGIPLLLLYLPYYWFDLRFFAPLTTSLAVTSGILLAALASRFSTIPKIAWALLIALIAHGVYRNWIPDAHPRNEALQRILTFAPLNAVIITALDPVFLEPSVLRGTERQALPFSRKVEFASKVIRVSPPEGAPTPKSPLDHRNQALMGPGSIEPVKHTAIEDPAVVDELILNGRPVVLDSSAITVAEFFKFKQRYQLSPLAEDLFMVKSTVP